MSLHITDSGIASAQKNMDIDARLLDEAAQNPVPILHLYEWEGPCATYGYFTQPELHFDMEGVRNQRLDLGKRPTGGGILFHLTDFAFSVIIPASHPAYSLNTMKNYLFINEAVALAIGRVMGKGGGELFYQGKQGGGKEMPSPFCMVKPTQYDVIFDGKKIGGAAQRRTMHGLLHQGTVSLAFPPEQFLRGVLLNADEVMGDMRSNGYYVLNDSHSESDLQVLRRDLRAHLAEELMQRLSML